VTVAPALKPLLILGELGKAWREVQKNPRRDLLDLVASSNKTVSTPETGSFNPIFLCFKPPKCVLQSPKLFTSLRDGNRPHRIVGQPLVTAKTSESTDCRKKKREEFDSHV